MNSIRLQYILSRSATYTVIILGLVSLYLNLTSARIYDLDAHLIIDSSGAILQRQSPYLFHFYYPYFTGLLLAPISIFSDSIRYDIWFILHLFLATISALLICYKSPNRLAIVASIFLFPPLLWDANTGQTSILIILGLSLFIFFYRKNTENRVGLSGISLSLLFFKPQIGIPIIAAILLYLYLTKNDYIGVAMPLTGSLVILTTISIGFDPTWITEWLSAMAEYRTLPENSTILSMFHQYNFAIGVVPLVLMEERGYWWITAGMCVVAGLWKLTGG